MRKHSAAVLAVIALVGGAISLSPAIASAVPQAHNARAVAGNGSRLVVQIDGIGSGRLRIVGHGISTVIRRSKAVRLPQGTYRVKALPVRRAATRYVPSPRTARLSVTRGGAATLRVTYSPGRTISKGAAVDPPPPGELGRVLVLLNQARATGVQCATDWMAPAPPVTYNNDLALAAQRHAQDMADRDYFSHESLDGRTFIDRIEATAYAGDPGGENIASGFQSAEDVMRGWLNSPGHCRNLMNPDFDHVGLGLAARNDARYSVPVTYWVQEFGYDPASYRY